MLKESTRVASTGVAATQVQEGWWCARDLAGDVGVNDGAGSDAGGSHSGFIAEFTPDVLANPWNKTELTYQVDTVGLSRALVAAIEQALQAWAAVTPFSFRPVSSEADLRFRFDGMVTDDNNITTAIAPWAAGWAQFGQITYSTTIAFDPLAVTLHEIGHFLGLGHSANREAAMYPAANATALSADDIEGIQSFYGARAITMPGDLGHSTSGADLITASFASNLAAPVVTDIAIGWTDNPDGADTAFYCVGYDVGPNGVARGGWSPHVAMGDALGHECQGMALATGFINPLGGDGLSRLDLVMVRLDNPAGENRALYRICFDVDETGFRVRADGVGDFGPDIEIPGPWGHESAGLAAALYDISRSGRPDLVVAWIDDPDGENAIFYKVGWDMAPDGTVATWSPRLNAGTSPVGSSSSGLGIAIDDLRGNGRPDLITFWVDNPDGNNVGYLRVGRDLDDTGVPIGGWDARRQIPGSWGDNTAGAGAALANVRDLLRPDLVVLTIDAPDAADRAMYRILSPPLPTWNLVRLVPNATRGTRRIAAHSPATPSDPNSQVLVLGAERSLPASGTIALATWDQTDLNENQGSDVVEFSTQTFPGARADGPVVLGSRLVKQVDAFWFGADHLLRTSWATVGAANSPAAGPAWATPVQPPGAAPARAAGAGVLAVAGSPLAVASIDETHIVAAYVGREDEVFVQRFKDGAGWSGASRIRLEWQTPLGGLAAAARSTRAYLYWADGSGAVWESSINKDNVEFTPKVVMPSGTVATWSPLRAVSRGPLNMDLFWINPAGRIMSAWWAQASGWSTPFEVGAGHVTASPSSLAAVHVWGQRLQVFWEEADQSVWTTWWEARPDGVASPWSPPVSVLPANSVTTGSDLAAASRANGRVRLFFIDSAGAVSETWWGTTP